MCECLKITFQIPDSESVVVQVNAAGELNGYNYFEFLIDEVFHYIWHDAFDNWYVTQTLGSLVGILTNIKDNIDECPLASIPIWFPGYFEEFTTERCDACPCLKITISTETESQVYYPTQIGEAEGYPTYEFNASPLVTETLSLWWSASWRVSIDGVGGPTQVADLNSDELCPSGDFKVVTNPYGAISFFVESTSCGCVKREDRQKFEFKSIRFPEMFIEQNRGLKDCCCGYNVLASADSESWKNDVTSAWIKLSDFIDSLTFTLLKQTGNAIYQPVSVPFPNEPNAFYCTINWKDVLATDGAGCYGLQIDFEIAGVPGSFKWGKYTLKPYSIENALTTARVLAKFNAYHEVEQIDFTGANVVSSHRFHGFIGFRQPNTEIDNIIYQNREMKRVIRENLNEYEIITDPEDECIIKPLIDLYLLSENQLFISDYNAHNHSYRYLDLPVIVQESPSIEYKDISRKAVLKCKVGDKFKNQRTFYND